MRDQTRSREIPSCSTIDLAEIRRSSKISSWIWSIISGVVTVLVRPGRGASQVEKSPRLNWAISYRRWHTLVHVPFMFLSEWRKFPSALCLVGKKTMKTARVSVLLKPRASPDILSSASVTRKDLQFGTWTHPYFQRHYRFRPTTSGSRSG